MFSRARQMLASQISCLQLYTSSCLLRPTVRSSCSFQREESCADVTWAQESKVRQHCPERCTDSCVGTGRRDVTVFNHLPSRCRWRSHMHSKEARPGKQLGAEQHWAKHFAPSALDSKPCQRNPMGKLTTSLKHFCRLESMLRLCCPNEGALLRLARCNRPN